MEARKGRAWPCAVHHENALVLEFATGIVRISFMKADTHPKNYRLMVFRDSASGESFLSKSCASTPLTATWEDGKEYPLYLMGISGFTHPFYTGQQKFVDTAGRVDKFQQRAARTAEMQAAKASGKKKA